jgi:hypothetical protein
LLKNVRVAAAWLRFTLLRFTFHGLERVLVRY